MKKAISIFLCVVLCLSVLCLSACGSEKKTLTVYTEAGFAPFEYYDVDGKTVIGVDMDIAKRIADELGWELDIESVNFDSIFAGLNNDNSLVIAGLSINPERAESVDFSDVYYKAKQTILFSTGSIVTNSNGEVELDSLNGLKIGVQTGTTGDLFVEDISGIQVKQYTRYIDAVTDIGNGGCNAVVVDNFVGEIFAKNFKGIIQAGIAGAEVEDYAVAVKKGNTELLKAVNKVLAEMKADGSLDASFEKHKDAE